MTESITARTERYAKAKALAQTYRGRLQEIYAYFLPTKS
jgi:hypothetical protein